MATSSFSRRLLQWHLTSGRHDLPWQKNRTPYRVWLAEIMLQQTQVSTVIPYYQSFLRTFPNLKRLAQAELEQVLAVWSGLGYYRRARHLHQCARTLVAEHHGRFPRTLEQLMQLPGIGRSTAGAIMALAWSQPYPILDGNVKRVLCRYHGVQNWPGETATENKLWQWSQQYTASAKDVAQYTQAIMDLGATLCRRSQPGCDACPFHQDCRARQQGLQDKIPLSPRKKSLPEKQVQMLLIYNQRSEALLLKRPPVGVWPNLWSFPECDVGSDPKHWCQKHLGIETEQWQRWEEYQHTFSHFKLRIQPRIARIEGRALGVTAHTDVNWVATRSNKRLAIAAPVKRLLLALSKQLQQQEN